MKSLRRFQNAVWRSLVRSGAFLLAITVIFLLLALPVAEEAPSPGTIRARRAQELLNVLRDELFIPNEVQIVVVYKHPLVFSVEPADRDKSQFILSVELGFLKALEDDELSAALAHELGHVWIFTHHPFLQTERLANTIGLRVVKRASFEKLYAKLWMYERTTGVPMDQLLGPLEEEPE
jgi:hypothetical protein